MIPSRRSFIRGAIAGLIAARLSADAINEPSNHAAHSTLVPADERFPYFQSTPVSYRRVRLLDEFWAPRQRTTREVSVAWVTKAHDRAGGLNAYRSQRESYRADASVVNMEAIKFIEAMAAVIGVERDKDIEGLINAWIQPLLAAQGMDGYLLENFPPGLERPPRRWQPVWWSHESYTIGHYIESALAHRQVTGGEVMYRSAVRAADNMVEQLLSGRHLYTSGHPEIEQALMRLYAETGERKYLNLCGWLLAQRGRHEGRRSFGRMRQDDLHVQDQRTIEGHAVMAAYLFNGATQFVAATGDSDYREAVLSVWEDFVDRKMFIHGGGGNLSSKIEGYRKEPYCILPEDAYCESCSVVANIQWAHSIFRLTGDAKPLDAAERMLCNALYASLSLSGDSSFYRNILQADKPTPRSKSLATSCCPPNIVKMINQVGGYFYSVDDAGVYVNHYGASQADIPWRDGLRLIQETSYPWSGDIGIRVEPTSPRAFVLRLRVPQWARSFSVTVNGKEQQAEVEKGWLAIHRRWQRGDHVNLTLHMPVVRVTMPPQFKEYENRVALQRGPIVYCLEAQDLGEEPVHESNPVVDYYGRLATLYLPEDSKVSIEHQTDFLGGVTVLTGDVRQLYWVNDKESVVRAKFIPYGVWSNRTPSAMRVWLGARKVPLVELLHPEQGIGESCVG